MTGVEKYVSRKTVRPNRELTEAAVQARENGYRSYGAMQAARYAGSYTSNIKEKAELKRRTDGYMTVRERMEIKGKQRNHGK